MKNNELLVKIDKNGHILIETLDNGGISYEDIDPAIDFIADWIDLKTVVDISSDE